MPGGVHRSDERARVESFVDAIPLGARGLLIEGDAGIGKTTLAEAALDLGRGAGFRVATVRIGEPEAGLSYSALGNLVDVLPDGALDDLPAPQREALDVALLRATSRDGGLDPRAVGLATLAVVRAACAERPVLVALDDVQWLDRSSAQVITFVLQRLHDEPVGVLATRRTGDGSALPLDLPRALGPERLTRIEVGPVSHDAFRQILHERLELQLPRPVTLRIHQQVGGNPFYGLEMAREIGRRGVPEPGAPLPVPDDAIHVVRSRVEALPPDSRRALAVVALSARPTMELITACLPDVDVARAVDDAERAEILVVRTSRLSFVHPLFATAVLAATSAPDQRALHARIAAAVGSPEEQARHLALSTSAPDATIATELDHASHAARVRGAVTEAVELALLAREFTPERDRPELARRTVAAGLLAFEAGDVGTAHDLLEKALESLPSGPDRARVMNLACEISWQDTVRVEQFATRALAEAGDDPTTRSSAHTSLAWTAMYRGRLDEAASHGRTAHDLAAGHEGSSLLGDAFTIGALIAFLRGEPHADLLERAVALQLSAGADPDDDTLTVYSSARVVRGLVHLWEGDLAAARRVLEGELSRYEQLGRYLARDEILCYLANLGCRSGAWDDAQRHADECLEIDAESGHLRGRGQNIVPHAWLAALRGDLDRARREAAEGLELSERFQDRLAAANAHGVLGFAALSAGELEGAIHHLGEVVDYVRCSGTVQPGVVPFVPDAVEALVAAGRLDDARAIVDDDRLMGRAAQRMELHASAARATALVLAAEGDLAAAAELMGSTLDRYAVQQQTFERARTLLALGEVERRRKRRAQAAAHLQESLREFDRLGARLWSAHAAAALSRSSTAGTDPDGLSPTERQLAQLVAEGRTNSEVADRMFLSVKTVEANLSRIYRKLGVRSRSELAARLSRSPRD